METTVRNTVGIRPLSVRMEAAVRMETPVRMEVSMQMFKPANSPDASILHTTIISSGSVDHIMKPYNIQSQYLLMNMFMMFNVSSYRDRSKINFWKRN